MVATRYDFSSSLASATHSRRIELRRPGPQTQAGADFFVMPSRFEPCGLGQLYARRYGTLPVVRAVGGLADTVVDATPAALAAGTATGFSFGPYTPAAFLEAVRRAVEMFRGHPDRWLQLVQTGMRQDWSWDRSAAEYERLYLRIVNQK